MILIKKMGLNRPKNIAKSDFGGRFVYKNVFLCIRDNEWLSNWGTIADSHSHRPYFGLYVVFPASY